MASLTMVSEISGSSSGPVANSGVGRTMDCADPSSGFINLRKTETDRQQLVLFAHGPGARKPESFAQPQHGFEPPDCPSCRVEGLKAADPRHRPLDPEVIALDPLLQVLGDVMERFLR